MYKFIDDIIKNNIKFYVIKEEQHVPYTRNQLCVDF